MSECTVEVTPMLLGTPGATLPPPVAFHYAHETISVRELIQRAVTEQIQTLQAHQTGNDSDIHKIIARQYLAEDDVSEQATSGMVKMPASPKQYRAPDIHQEVQRAQKSFEQGQFFITVNGFQPDTLDQQLLLTEHSKVLFMRLTPLVGG